MLSTSCQCGASKNPNAKQCMACANEARSHALRGRQHSAERVARIREGVQRKRAEGWAGYNIGAFTKGKPSTTAKPIGTTRVANGHIHIKCADGKWRYRARVFWEAAYGPIPKGRIIHHKNEDPFDDRLENLEMLTVAQHIAAHRAGRPQIGGKRRS